MKKAIAMALCLLSSTLAAGVPDFLHLRSRTQINFPLGNNPQPLAFSPDGQQLLERDESGMSLWSVDDQRLLWRFGLPEGREWQYMPKKAEWQGQQIILYASVNDSDIQYVTTLEAKTGKVLSQQKQSPPDYLTQVKPILPLVLPGIATNNLKADKSNIKYSLDKESASEDEEREITITYGISPNKNLIAFKVLSNRAGKYTPNEPIQVYDVTRKKVVWTFKSAFGDLLSFSPDSHYLGWHNWGKLSLWDMNNGQPVGILRSDPYETKDTTGTVQNYAIWDNDSRHVTFVEGSNLLTLFAVPGGELIRSQNKIAEVFSKQWVIANSTENELEVERPNGEKLHLGYSPGNTFFSVTDRSFISFSDPQTAWLYPSGQTQAIPLHFSRPIKVDYARLNMASKTLDLYGMVTKLDKDGDTRQLVSTQHLSLTAALGSKTTDTPVTLQISDQPQPEYSPDQSKCSTPGVNAASDKGEYLENYPLGLRFCQTPYFLTAWNLTDSTQKTPLWKRGLARETALHIDNDSQTFLLVTGRKIQLFRTSNGSLLANLTVPDMDADQDVTDYILSPDGRVLALPLDDGWQFFDLPTKTRLPAAAALQQASHPVFVNAGRTLAVLRDSAVVFYDLN